MRFMHPSFLDQAKQQLEQTTARATPARVKVLALLLAQNSAVTHQDIAMALERREKIDRVTLYRTLEWLTQQGFVHKLVGADRAWRFGMNRQAHEHHHHAHFTCQRCTEVICLESAPIHAELPALPEGYSGVAVELTVKGLCARCSSA
jgi:Fur family transcriptional regulator, ferric uptake regulator